MREKALRNNRLHSQKPNRPISNQGQEREKLTTAYDEETGKGKAELIHGRIATIIDEAAKIAGLAKRNIRIGGIRKPLPGNAQKRTRHIETTETQGRNMGGGSY